MDSPICPQNPQQNGRKRLRASPTAVKEHLETSSPFLLSLRAPLRRLLPLPCFVYDLPSALHCAVWPNFFAPIREGQRAQTLRVALTNALCAARSSMGSVDTIPPDAMLLAVCEACGGRRMAVIGLCVARELGAAFRAHLGAGGGLQVGDTWCAGTAFCGVQFFWVAESHRRRGIATAMVEAARRHVSYGFEVSPQHVAFAEPTENGRLFAARYTGRSDFLIF